MTSSKVLLVSAVLVGLVAVSSCRSLSGDLSGQKSYYSSAAPHYGGSPTPKYSSGAGHGTTPAPSYGSSTPTGSFPVPEIAMHGFIGSCDFWKNHPDAIVAAVGSLGDLGKTFGRLIAGGGKTKLENLHDALSNTRTDGFGALLREGAAAYLNAIVNTKFPFTAQQVKDRVLVATVASDDGAASAQAAIFKKANENHY